MRKDFALSRIQEDLKGDPDLARACAAIIEYVSTQSAHVMQRLTFRTLSNAANLPETHAIIPAAQYLSGTRVPLLEVAYMFIHENEEFEITNEEVAEAHETKVFYHPELGEPVQDYEKKIYIYFRLTPMGVDLCTSEK